MIFYFNTTIITLLISGLACFIIGLVSLIRSYIKKKKNKISSGWRLTILGTVLIAIFIPILIRLLQSEETENSLSTVTFFIIFFFFPFAFAGIVVCFIFFLGIGITSLKNGYTRSEEGKFDVESIVLGYVMLVLGAVVIFSTVMFIGATMSYIQESLRESVNRRNSRMELNPESLLEFKNYLFSVLYK